MDVSRSVNVLRRIAVGLRVIAWIELVLSMVMAANLAQKLAFVPLMEEATNAVTTTLDKVVPFAAVGGGVFVLLSGVVVWALLLAVAEVLMIIMAIEYNTRQVVEATPAKAPAQEPAGVA